MRAVWFKGPPVVREKGDMSVGDHQSYVLWETMPGSGTRGVEGFVSLFGDVPVEKRGEEYASDL